MKSTTLLSWVVLTLAACARSDPDPADRASSTTITSSPIEPFEIARVAGVRETDAVLTRRVERAIASDIELSLAARNVQVTVTEGIVTLLGSVDDVATRNTLTSAIEHVPGPSGSLNKLDISPSRNEGDRESDETIAFSLQRSFRWDPTVANEVDRVTIDVSWGVVTLRGATRSIAAASAVQKLAEQTPGVVAVSNDLRIEIP